MADIAALGLRVDGVQGIEQAKKALNDLATASTGAEKATEQLNEATGKSKKPLDDKSKSTDKVKESTDKVKESTDKAKESTNKARESTEKAIPAQERMAAASNKSSASMALLEKTALKLGGVIGAAFGVNALKNYADAWSDMQSKVGAAIGNMEAAPAAMQRLTEIANASYAPLSQTADVYARNVSAFKDLGRSADEAADFTEAVNNALVTTATRGQNADVVIGSLSRALATGKLDADAFDTIVSRSPRVLKAMADEMRGAGGAVGVTTRELRRLAMEGKVTSDVIVNGLTNSLSTLREEAALMPATLTDAFVRVNNNFTEFVGIVDKTTGASEAMAGAILGAADSIRELSQSQSFLDKMATAAGVAAKGVEYLAYAAGVLLVARMAAATIAVGAQGYAMVAAAVSMGRAGVAALAAAAANTALAVSARAAGAAMAVMGGPFGVMAAVVATATLALFDFSDKAAKAKEETELLALEVEKLNKRQAETAQFTLTQKLSEAEDEARSAAAMLRGVRKDYEELQAAAGAGKDIGAEGLRNVQQAVRDAEQALDDATTRAEGFREKLAQVANALANIDTAAPVNNAANELAAKTAKWLGQYATQVEKLEAKLAEARADFGGVIPVEVERRIRESFKPRGGGRTPKDDEGATFIKNQNERLALIGKETEYEQLLAKIRLGSIKFSSDAMREEALAQAQTLDFIKEQEATFKTWEQRRKSFGKGKDADSKILGDVSPLSGGEFDNQFARYEAEAELERERYQGVQDRLVEARELQIETNKSYDDLEYEAKRMHDARMQQIDSAKTSLMLSNAEKGFGALASIMRESQGEQSGIYRAMFAASKAFAIANATMNAYDAISKAWASAPFPANLAAVAATTPQVLAVVSAISSQSLAGMAHDGIDSVPQTGTWLLEKGERVTTANTSAKLDGVLNRIDSRQRGGDYGQASKAPKVIVQLMGQEFQGSQVSELPGSTDDERIIRVVSRDFARGGPAFESLTNYSNVQRVGR